MSEVFYFLFMGVIILEFFLQIVLLIAGFVLLIKGADWFVDGSSCIAAKMGIPQIVIGLTIVALGTSAPEAAVSITGALKQSAGITVGNVLGSNILNIFLILGIASLISPIPVKKNTVKYEMPFLIAISVIFMVMGILGSSLDIWDGIIMVLLLAIFFVYLIKISKDERKLTPEDKEEVKLPVGIKSRVWYMILITLIGLALIIFGSNLTVNSAKYLASAFGISDRIIGLTVVAFGTSLPELVTSVIASKKGKNDIAIGNIVGSNIFNILFVAGVSALITTVEFQTNFILDAIVAAAGAVILLVCCLPKKKLTRFGGAILLVCYGAYFANIIIQNI